MKLFYPKTLLVAIDNDYDLKEINNWFIDCVNPDKDWFQRFGKNPEARDIVNYIFNIYNKWIYQFIQYFIPKELYSDINELCLVKQLKEICYEPLLDYYKNKYNSSSK